MREPTTNASPDQSQAPAGSVTSPRWVREAIPDMTTLEQQAGNAVRPFTVQIPEDALDDLRRRLASTRWPSRELVGDRSQGVQLATMRALHQYWATEYDGRRVESRLNALPQFTTEIDGVDIHFVHVKSEHQNALPLIMTHGWPGSVIEMLDCVGPLTDPTAHGGTAADAFHLVLPSLPGYGFSGEPAEVGWDLARTARAWSQLMRRLGHDGYVAQGGNVGAGVTDVMGRLGLEGLAGIHTNLLVPALNDPASLPDDGDAERAAIKTFQTNGNGYFVEMATRPQTIGYALLDSPSALACTARKCAPCTCEAVRQHPQGCVPCSTQCRKPCTTSMNLSGSSMCGM